ncbi:MBL fold metallo-hydrolase [Streptacidiphilus monticola]|uniref:MBL fold metallo-hydrolase n=1 Tax=Streptacidiphilus monticola TaxID=2161674 RepID=A0ABW1G5X5_9ACTN
MSAVTSTSASATPSAPVRVHALGGPTALVEYGGLRLLTDPTFDEPRRYPMGPDRYLEKTRPSALTPEQVGTVDAVLLSHDQHPDNLDLTGRQYLAEVPLVLTTASAAGRVGGPALALPLWESHAVGDVTVTRVPALHGPEGCEPVVGEVAGFVLTGPGLPTVYISGDNASVRVVREIADRFPPFDLALLFAGAARTPLIPDAPLTLTATDTVEAARILQARHVVPLHCDSWAHFSESADDLRTAFAAADADLTGRLTLLAPGESAELR